MIQQYMDTSRPMPDVLLLEAGRKLDPTTAEYDKNNPRDSPLLAQYDRRRV